MLSDWFSLWYDIMMPENAFMPMPSFHPLVIGGRADARLPVRFYHVLGYELNDELAFTSLPFGGKVEK